MKNHPNDISRRKFLFTTATAALASPFAFSFTAPAKSMKKKLAHACIGVGGMGGHDLQQFMAHPAVEIVAICDVDQNILDKAAELDHHARESTAWREMLKREKKNNAYVKESIPDHNNVSSHMKR